MERSRRRGVAGFAGALLAVTFVLCGAGQGSGLAAADSSAASAASAESAESPTLAIEEMGFGGVFKAGHWTPVAVRVTAPASADLNGHLVVTTLDGDAVETRYGSYDAVRPEGDETAQPLTIPAGESRTVLRYFRAGRHRADLTASWRDPDGRTVAQTSRTLQGMLSASLDMIVSIGGDAGVEASLGLRTRSERARTSHSRLESGQYLPDQWYGYESVDLLVLTTSDEWWKQLTPDQSQALHRWLRLGGRILLSVGERGPEVAADGSPLAALLPGRFGGALFQGAPGLEQLAGATDRLDPLALAVLEATEGDVLAYDRTTGSDRLPLVVNSAEAFGQLIFVGVDLDQEPMSTWSSRSALLVTLMRGGEETTGEESRSRSGGQLAHLGFRDIAGQLRSAMDQFGDEEGRASVGTIGFSIVAGLVFLYILLIGPGDYFFLKKVLRRMEWTWVTFPLIVVVFTAGIWMLSNYLKGDGLRRNHVDIVDLDVVSGELRGTTWSQIYTPRSRRFDLRLRVAAAGVGARQATTAPTLLAWAGLPGSGMGGMDTAVNAATFLPPYAIETHPADADQPTYGSSISSMPLAVASTKSLVGRWSLQVPKDSLSEASELTSDDGILQGTFVNPLDIPLRDCTVMYQNWAYRIDSVLQPGEMVAVDSLVRRDLEWRLTRRRLLRSETSYATTPWDATSLNVPRILEMMMFHGAAGGSSYTGLSHQYYDFIDLSSHLNMQRAVLVGRAESPATELLSSGESLEDSPHHWAFYRIVYPVQSSR